jgi:hypothetical protein
MAETQIDTLLENADALEKAIDQAKPLEGGEALGGGSPAPNSFSTAYLLTAEQEKNLVEHAIRRLRETEADMGRNLTRSAAWHNNMSGGIPAHDTFLGRRQIFEWIYENNVSWRPFTMGGIFEHSNLIVPLTRRIARQMIARAVKYFLGTDPWFGVLPEGSSDRNVADRLEKYARFKFDRLKIKDALKMAIQIAFVRGECVVKTTYTQKDQIFKKLLRVLVDGQGNPIMAADGDFITENDRFAPSQDGQMVLQRDMQTPQPLFPIFMEQLVTRKSDIFIGPAAEPVYFQDFLCPLTAASVDDADFCAHLYDAPVMELADLYRKKGVGSEDPDEEVARIRSVIEQIRLASSETGNPKTGAGQSRSERGEGQVGVNNSSQPSLEVAECYIRYDADGDGITEEIMLLLDVKNQKAIFYEYTANVTADGKRPFTVLRVNPVDGRWYGIGAVEQFKSSQDFIDLTVNRLNFAQGASGRITFWRPDATYEGSSNPNLVLNNGGTYTLRPGFSAKDAVEYVALPETKNDQLNFMLNYFTQIVQLESGIVNPGDQDFAGLPSSKLATGIRSIDASGQEMFSQYIQDMLAPLMQIMNRLVLLLLKNLDKKEAFNYLEGDALSLISIGPDDVKGMELNIKLLLTRFYGEQQLQSNAQAANLVTQFYSLPPEIQQKVSLFYTQSLKSLGVVEAEQIIQPFEVTGATTQDGRVFGQAGSPGAPAGAVGNPRQVPLDPGSAGG